VDLDEILYGGVDIEDDLDSITLNAVASTIPNGERLNFWGGATYEPISGFGWKLVWRWWR
jgi:hypothetical protein